MQPDEQRNQPAQRLLVATLWVALGLMSLALVRVGKDFFVPLVIAIIAVYLIKILARLIGTARLGTRRLPESVALLLSFLIILAFSYLLISIVADNALKVAEVVPRYRERLVQLHAQLFSALRVEQSRAMGDLLGQVDFTEIITAVATNLAALLKNTTLIFIYGIFLLFEARWIPAKIDALFPGEGQRGVADELIRRIDRDIQTYFGVKTLISAATAILSYAVMRWVNLDFAAFWALLVFILNFIPTIGSIVATVVPSLFALLQFQGFGPFLVVAIGIAAIQQLLGNLIEPNLMGHTLNLSPLVVVMSLILWGILWGVVGMFLCVPITVICVIVLSNFESTRWVSVLLSKTGRVGSA
jgi:predicted PurR-regulated permease PerM